jgi:hypothetical protein
VIFSILAKKLNGLKVKNTAMNNKLYNTDLAHYSDGDFRINYSLEVFFGKEQIGSVRIVENKDPESDDEIVCFLPGGIGFQHYPIFDAESACQTIYKEYYSQKDRR